MNLWIQTHNFTRQEKFPETHREEYMLSQRNHTFAARQLKLLQGAFGDSGQANFTPTGV